MTNRKDMIDEAVLRPGRLEVHVEVGLPDEEGRIQILNIHTGAMRKGGLIADDVSVPELAARTKNYTGAELEGLVRAACTHLYSRRIDMADLSKAADFRGAQVTREDFERALVDVQPAFGVKEEELARLVANGIVSFGPDFDAVQATLMQLVRQVATSERSGLVSAVLTGKPGSGKSALTAHIARVSGFPFVKRISGETLVSLHEAGKADAIARVFNDAHKSPLSLIILDDIERIIEYVRVGHRFSNAVLQTLLVLVKALPPSGRRLLVLGTTSIPELLEEMELMTAFQLRVDLPELKTEAHFATVLAATELMAPEEVDAAAKHLATSRGVTIKKLLNTLEMARLDGEAAVGGAGGGGGGGAAVGGAGGGASPALAKAGGPLVTFDSFVEAAMKWGL
jgi:vesicle-fusing ATPase